METNIQKYWRLSRAWNQVSGKFESTFTVEEAMTECALILETSNPAGRLYSLVQELYSSIILFGTKAQKQKAIKNKAQTTKTSTTNLRG